MFKWTLPLAATLSATPAEAQTPEPRTGTRITDDLRYALVSYRDLNLTSSRDLRRLQARVRGAVREVCPDRIIMALPERIELPVCRKNAFGQAERQIQRAIALASGGERLAGASMITIAIPAPPSRGP